MLHLSNKSLIKVKRRNKIVKIYVKIMLNETGFLSFPHVYDELLELFEKTSSRPKSEQFRLPHDELKLRFH